MADLGSKHECTSCGTKFYDLGRDQPICPSCGLNQLAEEEPEPVEEETPEESEEVEESPEETADEPDGEAGDKKADDEKADDKGEASDDSDK